MQASKLLVAVAGSCQPSELRAAHIAEANAEIAARGYAHSTRANKVSGLRRVLRWLWENHGAPKLDDLVRKYPGLRPRNVTVRDDEREKLLKVAGPKMRLWILLCSDLAIRSTTSANIGSRNYDPIERTLRFETKCGERLTLPVTEEIRELIESCDLESDVPFVYQLWERERKQGPHPHAVNDCGPLRREFKSLRIQVGITRRITLHDLRRTTAVAMLEETGDIRDVQSLLGHRNLQSTVWYLDHDLRPIKRSTLEILKRPAWRKEQTA